jgi:hypothetical protein
MPREKRSLARERKSDEKHTEERAEKRHKSKRLEIDEEDKRHIVEEPKEEEEEEEVDGPVKGEGKEEKEKPPRKVRQRVKRTLRKIRKSINCSHKKRIIPKVVIERICRAAVHGHDPPRISKRAFELIHQMVEYQIHLILGMAYKRRRENKSKGGVRVIDRNIEGAFETWCEGKSGEFMAHYRAAMKAQREYYYKRKGIAVPADHEKQESTFVPDGL